MMRLLIDTTKDGTGLKAANALQQQITKAEYEYVNTAGMNISHCLGCNFCWLKTPGECVVKDDYEPLLKKISAADQVWLITDTKFGFVSCRAKNIVDRVMPLVTMNLHIAGKQMRHIPRYQKNPDWGIVYTGDGDKAYLSAWCERVAVNFAARSLGVYSSAEIEEAIACML